MLMELSLLGVSALLLLLLLLLLTATAEEATAQEATAASITRVAICRTVLNATDVTDTLLRLSLPIFRHCVRKLLTVASVRYWDLLVVRDRELAI